MARVKTPVVEIYPTTKPEVAFPSLDSLQTPSESFSSSSITSTCPHCNFAFQDMPITVFRDHVASCTQPSTGNDGSSGSSLSTPPVSPSRRLGKIIVGPGAKRVVEAVTLKYVSGVARQTIPEEPFSTLTENVVRPYINPRAEFDYYNQIEGQEGSDIEQKAPESTERFPFPKVTAVEIFEEHLKDPEDMTYEQLYDRTARVSDSLVAYQAEWDGIEREIIAHEMLMKAEEKRAEEKAKVAMEDERIREDLERAQVAETYKDKLNFQGKKWQEFITDFEAKHTKEIRTLRHLLNLRNPQFMAASRKKQREIENKAKKLVDVPYQEVKKTKEEIEAERRKRGRLMDPVRFDDIKTADAYGFEYSSHIKHYGQQPMLVVPRQSNPIGEDTNEASRTRTQRKQTRKVYEAELSASPESEDEDGKLPAKRTRRPKIFEDGVETIGRSRGPSRSDTPVVRTFASGKRVGRPPTKSKLQAVQLATSSSTPEQAQNNESQSAEAVEGHGEEKGAELRELAPLQQAQLHDAAESLVNQTVSDKAAAATSNNVKPKHAGGRPRKIIPGGSTTANPSKISASDVPLPKPRNKGGRPRKNAIPTESTSQNIVEPAPQLPKPKSVGGRRFKSEHIMQDNTVQLGDENGVLQSTEQDDGSQYTSTTTSRPTTSSSNATVSSFASRRSDRPATRDKTNAREGHGTFKTEGVSLNIQEPANSTSASSRGKRKRATDDTEPSPIIVDSAPSQFIGPPIKKRKARTERESSDDSTDEIPETSSARSKRKRDDTVNESIAVAGPSTPITIAPAPKKRNIHGIKQEETAQEEEEDSDAGIDEESLDPVAREALRKKRVKKEKSRKLSRNMKARWANGGMKEAQETRKANNALKKAAKVAAAAAEAAGLPPPILPPVPVTTPAVTTAAPKTNIIKKKSKHKPGPPIRPASTRVRKPTRALAGLDGAGDDEDELEQQFASEYDRYQALTNNRGPIVLGKRVRKSLMDLSQAMDESDEEEFSL